MFPSCFVYDIFIFVYVGKIYLSNRTDELVKSDLFLRTLICPIIMLQGKAKKLDSLNNLVTIYALIVFFFTLTLAD